MVYEVIAHWTMDKVYIHGPVDDIFSKNSFLIQGYNSNTLDKEYLDRLWSQNIVDMGTVKLEIKYTYMDQ